MQHAFTPMRGDLTTGLPRPLLGLRITPFDDGRESGRYLIESENGNFVVNDRMRCLIEALAAHSSMSALKAHLEVGAHATLDEADISAAITWLPQSLFVEAPREPQKTPFHFSRSLLPAKQVQRIAQHLRFLYSPVVMTIIGVVFSLWLPWLIEGLPRGLGFHLTPGGLLFFALGVCITAFLHEAGHAAACAWYGVPSGEIGFGLYLIFPVFYTDVTKAWRLSRHQRAVVDLGGIYFQLILIAALVPLAHARGGTDWLYFFILFNFYVILHNLNPLFKMDGYWLFSDLAGVPNLHRRTWSIFREVVLGRAASAPDSPWNETRRPLIYGYALAVLGYAAFIGTTLPRWYAAQLVPYPAIASGHLHAIATAWGAAEYAAGLAALGHLAGVSFVPALIVALPVSWIVRGSRRLLCQK